MFDELMINFACKMTFTGKEKRLGKDGSLEFLEYFGTTFHVDFSYLAKYKNVHYVICMQPRAFHTKNYNIVFPKAVDTQHYQGLNHR